MYRTAGDNPWLLFPSSTSKSGHIEEPKRAWNALLKRANIENLRIHDDMHWVAVSDLLSHPQLPADLIVSETLVQNLD